MGKKSKIDIDTEKVTLFSDTINTGSNLISGTVDSSQKDFGVLKKNKIFSNGFNKIEKGYSEVQQSLKGYVSILNDYYEDLGTTEKKYVSAVESIEVPRSFILNDVLFASTNKEVDLKKKDGKSVVDGNDSVSESELNTSTGILKDVVFDQTKEEVKTSVYDEASIIKKADLLDATTTTEAKESVFDDVYTVNGLRLADVTGEALKDVVIEDKYNVQQVDLKDVNAFQAVNTIVDGNELEYTIGNKEKLENIDKEGVTV